MLRISHIAVDIKDIHEDLQRISQIPRQPKYIVADGVKKLI